MQIKHMPLCCKNPEQTGTHWSNDIWILMAARATIFTGSRVVVLSKAGYAELNFYCKSKILEIK